MRLVIGIVIAGAALLPAAAHGHDGGLWFQTAANTSRNIPDKYPTVASARCQPLAAAQRVLYHATRCFRTACATGTTSSAR